MLSETVIRDQLANVLVETDFSFLGERYIGKVRDNYTKGNVRYLIASDRLSCFDVVVTSVPFKGEVLTQLAWHWFQLSQDIVPNHVLDIPDPNVMKVKNCAMLPVEVVVRGYLAGSAWRDYQAGRLISGVQLPAGLKNCQKLPEILITPSTKAEKGKHDEPISEAQIVATGLVSQSLWTQVRETALALFKRGTEEAARRGLILVDTKYEFGLSQGQLTLVDEIHTLDSSRYWKASSYAERLSRGESPEMLDKEPTRQWLLAQGFKGDGPIPAFTPEHRISIAQHYIGAYEQIVGKEFKGHAGPVAARIFENLKK